MRVLLISTYELGRQPFGLASPAAWLRDAAFDVRAVDVSREPLAAEDVGAAALVAFYLPMHTATRLAVPLIARVRRWNPAAELCCYGLYAPLNAPYLRALGVRHVLGGEFEADLVALAERLRCTPRPAPPGRSTLQPGLPRLAFRVPDRSGLPPLDRYASLVASDGRLKTVGYTEASRGCRHRCRHCPVVPVYGGRFRIVSREVVLADVRAQVEAGAAHLTFGDPDFFNGVRHAVGVVEALAREFPGLTYDVTIKIEHLLRHARWLPTLRDTGCLFVTSAVEAIDDEVLARLEKGHTRADFERVVALCRDVGLCLAPTFVAFTPWISLDGYCDLLDAIAALDLVDRVAPIQLAIRLLIPAGSRLLELDEVRALVGPFDPGMLAYPWRHPDPRVDALQEEIADLVGARPAAPRRSVFEAIARVACERARRRLPPGDVNRAPDRATVPYLNEPWYC